MVFCDGITLPHTMYLNEYKPILIGVVCPEAEFLDVIETSFPPCYFHSPLLSDFAPPSPLEQNWFEMDFYVNIVYIKSENSEDYAQKPQRNCPFKNSASVC